MALTDTLRRAPRWAWVTAAGIGLGAGAITLWRHRGAPAKDVAATDATADPYSGPLPTTTGNPVATIVPPVILGGNNNGDGNALTELFAGTIAGIVGSWQDVIGGSMGVTDQALAFVGQSGQTYQDIWGPIQSSQSELLSGFASTIQDLALAGPSPQSVPITDPSQNQQPAPIVLVAPPAPQAPTPIPAPTAPPPPTCGGSFPEGNPPNCLRTEYDNRTRDNGKSGSARRVWCNRVKIHRYQDGHAVVVSEDKIRDGSC